MQNGHGRTCGKDCLKILMNQLLDCLARAEQVQLGSVVLVSETLGKGVRLQELPKGATVPLARKMAGHRCCIVVKYLGI